MIWLSVFSKRLLFIFFNCFCKDLCYWVISLLIFMILLSNDVVSVVNFLWMFLLIKCNKIFKRGDGIFLLIFFFWVVVMKIFVSRTYNIGVLVLINILMSLIVNFFWSVYIFIRFVFLGFFGLYLRCCCNWYIEFWK